MSNDTEKTLTPAQRREASHQQLVGIMADQLSARALSSCAGPNESELTFWGIAGGHLVITQLWKDGGWEYYTQGDESRLEFVSKAMLASRQPAKMLAALSRIVSITSCSGGPARLVEEYRHIAGAAVLEAVTP